MGKLEGHTQVCLYIPEVVWKEAKLAAMKIDCPIYKLVSDALEAAIAKHLPPSERKALKSFLGTNKKSPPSKRSPKGKKPPVKIPPKKASTKS